MNFLDNTGLSYVWTKLKNYFQPKLVSGTNIKTINNDSILGSGDLQITSGVSDVQIDSISIVSSGVANILTATLLDVFYPVGSYYETSDTTFNPNTSWGGTWVLEAEGIVHVSGGTNYSVNHADDNNGVGTQDGGSKQIQEHHHGFTNPSVTGGGITNGITGGSHKHDLNIYSSTGTSSAYVIQIASVKYTKDRSRMHDESHTHSLPSHSHTVNGGAVGSVAGATAGLPESSSEGNMPPYIIVNRWHRTA